MIILCTPALIHHATHSKGSSVAILVRATSIAVTSSQIGLVGILSILILDF
jgi:hypothetical protein